MLELEEEDLTAPSERVRKFITRVEGKLRHHPVWRQDTHDPDLWQETIDALGMNPLELALCFVAHPDLFWLVYTIEAFVMSKVHDSVFATWSKDVSKDEELKLAMAGLQWIDFRHLDMPEISSNFAPAWELAQEALREMNNFKAVGR